MFLSASPSNQTKDTNRSRLRRLSKNGPFPGVIAIAGALVVGACSHVPLRSVPALSAIDFETTEFSSLMALVDLPAQLQPQMDSARLNVVLTIEGSVVEERSFVLVQHSAGSDADLAGHTVDDGRHAFTYSLAPNDARSLGAIRRAVAAAKQADQRGSLTMGVGLTDLCADDFLPDGPLLVDVFLKTSETGRYVRTLDGYDLRELSEGELVDIMPCL